MTSKQPTPPPEETDEQRVARRAQTSPPPPPKKMANEDMVSLENYNILVNCLRKERAAVKLAINAIANELRFFNAALGSVSDTLQGMNKRHKELCAGLDEIQQAIEKAELPNVCNSNGI